MNTEKKRMKALFLIFHGFNEANGISKKIRYQVKALKECGVDVRLCHYDVTPYGERRWMVILAQALPQRYGDVSITRLLLTMPAVKESTLYTCALFTTPVLSPFDW